jgi:hypothetical protein
MNGRKFTVGQWFTLILALPGGFLLGLMTGFLQACTFKLGSIPIQWGLVAALFLIWVAIRLPSYDVRTRWAGILVSLGWLIATVMLAIRTPAGAQALVGDTGSMVYIALGSMCVGVAAAWPLIYKDEAPVDAADTDPDLVPAPESQQLASAEASVGGVTVVQPSVTEPLVD